MIKFITLSCLVAVTLGGAIPETDYKLQGHIVGGKDTDIKEVPYTVALLTDGQFFCGGSIVARHFVVTAAHCVFGQNPRTISVRAGSSKANHGGVVVNVKKIHVHPKYSPNRSDKDVAVLQLEEPLVFSETVQPIELGTVEPSPNTLLRVSGYGLLDEAGGLPEYLQSVLVPAVDRETCRNNYITYLRITDTMLCAGIHGRDSCQGDSGGPLVHGNKLVGVVSFGVGCARPNLPGVYASVSHQEIFPFLMKHIVV